MNYLKRSLQNVMNRSLLHPGSWVAWGVLFIAVWGLVHLLGWRSATSVICGTVDSSGSYAQWSMFRGAFYALTYFAAVIVSPILFLSAGLYIAGMHLFGPKTLQN